MDNGVEKALEQIRQKDEAGLNYIYSKTYNFVYLRAKTVLKNEEDVKALMQKVYLRAYHSANDLKKENLYEWLGKCVYEIGCQSYEKKKEKEVSFLEMEKDELRLKKTEQDNKSIEFVCGLLENLPDMHLSVLFAFYYDYLKVDEIADIMGCTQKVVKNRLNDCRRYIKAEMERQMEERSGEELSFSIGNVRSALRKWSFDHCLGMATAQSVYSRICKETGMKAGSISLDGKEFAGVKNTIVYHGQDGLHAIQQEVLQHEKKQEPDKKRMIVGIGAAVIAVVLIVSAVFLTKRPKPETKPEKEITVADQRDEPAQKPKDETGQEPVNEPKDETEPAEEAETVPETETVPQPPAESEYIFERSQTEVLTEEEIRTHSREELRFGRNEIYARYGVIFGVEDLDAYFRGKSWYTPKIGLEDFKNSMELSLLEEGNINLIRKIESEMP